MRGLAAAVVIAGMLIAGALAVYGRWQIVATADSERFLVLDRWFGTLKYCQYAPRTLRTSTAPAAGPIDRCSTVSSATQRGEGPAPVGHDTPLPRAP